MITAPALFQSDDWLCNSHRISDNPRTIRPVVQSDPEPAGNKAKAQVAVLNTSTTPRPVISKSTADNLQFRPHARGQCGSILTLFHPQRAAPSRPAMTASVSTTRYPRGPARSDEPTAKHCPVVRLLCWRGQSAAPPPPSRHFLDYLARALDPGSRPRAHRRGFVFRQRPCTGLCASFQSRENQGRGS
jgi:hypothetical protein